MRIFYHVTHLDHSSMLLGHIFTFKDKQWNVCLLYNQRCKKFAGGIGIKLEGMGSCSACSCHYFIHYQREKVSGHGRCFAEESYSVATLWRLALVRAFYCCFKRNHEQNRKEKIMLLFKMCFCKCQWRQQGTQQKNLVNGKEHTFISQGGEPRNLGEPRSFQECLVDRKGGIVEGLSQN